MSSHTPGYTFVSLSRLQNEPRENMGFILWVRPVTLMGSFSGAFMKSHNEGSLVN